MITEHIRYDITSMPRGWLIAAMLIALSLIAAGCTRAAPAPASIANARNILDLTHTLDAEFPFIPVPNVTYGFSLKPIATLDTMGVNANEWHIHEHLGTQIDSPLHFTRGGRALEQIRTDELIRPVVVIDFRDASAANVDAALTSADVRAWEERHGRIPKGAVVMVNFGWSQHLHSPRYIGLDEQHVKHFPGVAVDAVDWLVRERDIWGIGVDTISFDPGIDGEYRTHKALLGADRWALEAVANLDRLPATGATLIIGAPKVAGGTGGPVRLIAIW